MQRCPAAASCIPSLASARHRDGAHMHACMYRDSRQREHRTNTDAETGRVQTGKAQGAKAGRTDAAEVPDEDLLIGLLIATAAADADGQARLERVPVEGALDALKQDDLVARVAQGHEAVVHEEVVIGALAVREAQLVAVDDVRRRHHLRRPSREGREVHAVTAVAFS